MGSHTINIVYIFAFDMSENFTCRFYFGIVSITRLIMEFSYYPYTFCNGATLRDGSNDQSIFDFIEKNNFGLLLMCGSHSYQFMYNQLIGLCSYCFSNNSKTNSIFWSLLITLEIKSSNYNYNVIFCFSSC